MILVSVRAIENSNIMSPDSLRQFLKLNKSMYNLHTSKNYGLDDTGGIQYAGTVENFGSEILIESNKLRLNRPPIDSLTISSILRFYFNIDFCEPLNDIAGCYVYQNTNRFYKQNLMCGLLRTDRLIDGYSYSLIYNNIQLVYGLGSDNVSEYEVNRMAFFKTTTPPTLRIVDTSNVTTNVSLTVDDGSDVDTIYYFPINLTTFDLLGLDYPVDSYINNIATAGTFTIDINRYCHDNIPYIWFAVDRFRHLPDFELNDNESYNHQSLLTAGIDGNNVMHLYPKVGTPPCVPSAISEGGKWWIKAYGDFQHNMSYGGINRVVSGKITKIEYLYSDTVNPQSEPLFRRDITYDDSHYKIMLNTRYVNWLFDYPRYGDYDYTENEDIPMEYAYIELSEFDGNEPSSSIINNNIELKPAFDVSFDDRKYIDYFEQKMNHGTSGLHIDYTTDYSENGVNKLRGVVHGLGKFDGLPRYYNEWMRETHRAHVELYSIRDSIFNNSNPMNRQTTGLIIDSGVPQNDVESIGADSRICIAYIGNANFDTIEESESSTNWLSDLGYHDDKTFTYTGNPIYATDPKFIYHGNGVFSLGVQGFDPELEMGRIFLISNDPASYENNALSDNTKAERTLARICDIPTSFVQLINIKNVSPTYALDPYYTRMGASWSSRQEEMLWNERCPNFVVYNNKRVFGVNDDLDSIISEQYMRDNYSLMYNFDRYLDMTHPSTSSEFEFSVYNTPDGYEDGDKVNIVLGGINFKATVNIVSHVMSISVEDKDSETLVNIDNIPSRESVLKTTTVTGTGNGLEVELTIDQTVWDNLHMQRGNVNPDVYALKLDSIGRIWCWRFTGTHWVKDHLLTGNEYGYNFYFEEVSEHIAASMSLKNVMLYNNFLPGFTYLQPIRTPRRYNDLNAIDGTLDINSDLSEYITNYDETFYVVYHGEEFDHNVAEYKLSRASEESYYFNDRKMLPAYHNIQSFYAYTPVCKLTCDSLYGEDLIKQPEVCIYNPTKNKEYDMVEYVYNEAIVNDISKYTLKDILDPEWFSQDILVQNIYGHKYANDITSFDQQRAYYETLNRQNLIDLIYSYDPMSDPIIFEGSSSEYTKDMLIDYILNRTHFKGNDTKLLARRGSNQNNITEIGGYNKVIDMYPEHLTTRNQDELTSYPTSVYKIDFIHSISDLQSFRMYDDLGNDISRYCMIMINNVLYVFVGTEWKRVRTRRSDN